MKAYRAFRGIPVHILNLGVGWPTFQRIAALKTKQCKKIWTAWRSRWRHCHVSKRQCLFVDWQNVKIRKIWIFVSAAVRTANLAAQNTFLNSAHRPDETVCSCEVHSIGAMYPHTCFFEMVSVLVCHLRTEHLKCLSLSVYDQTVICVSFRCVIHVLPIPYALICSF